MRGPAGSRLVFVRVVSSAIFTAAGVIGGLAAAMGAYAVMSRMGAANRAPQGWF